MFHRQVLKISIKIFDDLTRNPATPVKIFYPILYYNAMQLVNLTAFHNHTKNDMPHESHLI